MKVIDLRPRGYCHGVVNALNILKKVIHDPTYQRPIYVLGQIVHNHKITEAFNHYGVISLDQKDKTRLELLDMIETGTVVFTAHGISDDVILKAKQKNLTYINATCKDVYKVHEKVRSYLKKDFKVIYIGKKNHPEPEAVLAIDNRIYFVENQNDIQNLPDLKHSNVFVTNQTTLSFFDIKPLLQSIKEIIPNYIFDNDICNATTTRQEAVMNQPDADLLLVVGDEKSSNSNKLSHVSNTYRHIKSYLISDVSDINLEWLHNIQCVSITSGASTPTAVTNEVITFLKQYDPKHEDTWDHKSKITYLDILG